MTAAQKAPCYVKVSSLGCLPWGCSPGHYSGFWRGMAAVGGERWVKKVMGLGGWCCLSGSAADDGAVRWQIGDLLTSAFISGTVQVF